MDITSSSFYDNHGLVHAVPNQVSENGPLFTAEEMILEEMLFEKHGKSVGNMFKIAATANILTVWDHTEKRYKDRGGEAGYHFSHDNMTGVYAMSRWAKWLPKSGLDKQVSDPNWFFHPRDRLFYGLCEMKWWAIIGYPLVFLALFVMSVQSCIEPKSRTSGKLLWLVRTRTLIGHGAPLARWWYSYLTDTLKKEHGETPWVDVFSIYFPYENHPSNILARQIWSEK